MATFKQEMPPPGGYALFNVFNKTVRKPLNGLYLIAALYACTFVGIKLRDWGYARREARLNENREVRIALTPFLLAEQQRMYLKHLVRNQDYEKELMKDVPGWEVGHWHDCPVYHNPRDLWCEPSMQEYYAHQSKNIREKHLCAHLEY
uniref:NADH dehydrogenase [ubiquinone] 1 alpha subcomplex subunit 13 n=1 Tax=Schistocephalus solidus TaxID=70667 RepID=A0A0X3Q322_SCHSO